MKSRSTVDKMRFLSIKSTSAPLSRDLVHFLGRFYRKYSICAAIVIEDLLNDERTTNSTRRLLRFPHSLLVSPRQIER